MSIKIARNQILKFVRSPDPSVLALRGPWGAGKTHAWKGYLLEANNTDEVGLQKYSYVSLFGLDSMRSLKTAIFENSVTGKDIGTNPTIEANAKALVSVAKSYGKKSIHMASRFFNNHEETVEYLTFSTIRNTLICIDDLERRSDALSLKDVLGLVSHLKEEKGCKVALVLNDAEENLSEYYKYREKVIDIELKFDPSPEESADLAFSGRTDEISQMLSKVSIQFNVRNIRILRKADFLAKELCACLEEIEESLRHEILQSLMLYVWSAYGSSEGAPELSYIKNTRQRIVAIESSDNRERSENEKEWDEILESFGFTYTDEIDLLLIQGVEAGYFDVEQLQEKVQAKNLEVLRQSGQQRYSNAWNVFHHSFDDNTNEVIDTLYDEFMANAKHITTVNLNGTIRLLKELGEHTKANEVLEKYIEVRSNEPGLFDLTNSYFWGDVLDADMTRRFGEVVSTEPANNSLCEVLLRMTRKNGYSDEEEQVLLGASQADYFEVFTTYKGENLRRIVRKSLQFSNIVNGHAEQKAASERARQALKEISEQSILNKLRIDTYDIDFDSTAEAETETDTEQSNEAEN